MIYKVDEKEKSIKAIRSTWNPKEIELERYMWNEHNAHEGILNASIFGEPLLLIDNQVRTQHNKRADILALDRNGNQVIIELKREMGYMGVETQALQYLADFFKYRGKEFLKRFSQDPEKLYAKIRGFCEVKEEDIGRYNRIILMARGFDPSLFSMGSWLVKNNVAFRCIKYFPFEINGEKHLSFSTAFDQSPMEIYPLYFQPQSEIRDPGIFWHNIGIDRQDWWEYLLDSGQISASFDGVPGDEGEKLMKSYRRGDTIIAYCNRKGAVGYGVIPDIDSYRLIEAKSTEDKIGDDHLHRMGVHWVKWTRDLNKGIKSDVVRNDFGIYHPISASVGIPRITGLKLLDALLGRLPEGPGTDKPLPV